MKTVIELLKIAYTLVLLPTVIILTIVIGLTAITISFFSKRVAHYFEKLYFNCILTVTFTKVNVEGIENIENTKNYVVISNHQSAFDIVTLSAKLPLRIVWVSKESVFKIPIIGQFMKSMGYISIPREKIRESINAVKEGSKKINGSPTIFPEGTRSSDGRLQKFKKGFLIIAENTGLDILPVVIKGTINIMRKGSLVVTPFVNVSLKILPPIRNDYVIGNPNILEELYSLYISNLS
ncbi:MAG: lysophospholipid acyltransferase family protein [Spirochaetia bacterium]|nr:1-acyl-sn-glycerol-3-phosphate acyltransferase [Spirochaetota bacterium]MCX8096032.1 1-acyl-sn-glycerol-3-phosphate acyltransferase [Spirochaetota bacterium]MDW8111827.1 lysophospholipid acyltransferase family protein [Spirochaetia bacterium]